MSNTENNTQETTEEVNTAPYLKKDKKAEPTTDKPSKSNMIIPIVLLLVSVIVIGATFYEDEYKQLLTAGADSLEDVEIAVQELTENSSPTEESITSVNPSTEASAEESIASLAPPAVASEPLASEPLASDPLASEKADAEKTPTTESLIATSQPATVASHMATVTPGITATPTPEKKNSARFSRAPMQASNTANPQQRANNYQQAREQAMQRAQMQAKKHNEMIQQRRQAYESEMQTRRQQHDARMKAYQEQQSKVAETQKAIFQRVQDGRIDTAQKLQEMHKQISKMHEELHKIMRQPHQTSETSAEQI